MPGTYFVVTTKEKFQFVWDPFNVNFWLCNKLIDSFKAIYVALRYGIIILPYFDHCYRV